MSDSDPVPQDSSGRQWLRRFWPKKGAYDPRDYVTPEAFSVKPELLGTPLAKPYKRLAAWAIDALIVAVVSQLSNVLLALALALLCDRLLRQTKFLSGDQYRQYLRMALVVGFLAWAGFQMLSHGNGRHPEKAVPTAKADANKHEPLTDEERVANIESEVRKEDQDVEVLKEEVKELEKERRFSLMGSIRKVLDDIGFDIGWAAVYWTFITAWWNGQTFGKRLFGLRVLQLNGKPLTIMDSFSRYGGYAAGVATGLAGFAQVYWDPNRQAIHDKVSFTVVADERRPKLAWSPETSLTL